jgi:hypothetical protein
MQTRQPIRTALGAALLAVAWSLAAPASADEPALPQFDPDSVVMLHNGLNWVDLNGDGEDDLIFGTTEYGASYFWQYFEFGVREPDAVGGET